MLPVKEVRVSVTAMELAVLLYHLEMGAHFKDVGYEDVYRTLDDSINELNRHFHVKQSLIESALWSCNLLNELNPRLFWHPKNYTFDTFIKKMLPPEAKFDKYYNLLTLEGDTKDGKNKESKGAKPSSRKKSSTDSFVSGPRDYYRSRY